MQRTFCYFPASNDIPVIRDACDQQISGGDIGKARLLFPD